MTPWSARSSAAQSPVRWARDAWANLARMASTAGSASASAMMGCIGRLGSLRLPAAGLEARIHEVCMLLLFAVWSATAAAQTASTVALEPTSRGRVSGPSASVASAPVVAPAPRPAPQALRGGGRTMGTLTTDAGTAASEASADRTLPSVPTRRDTDAAGQPQRSGTGPVRGALTPDADTPAASLQRDGLGRRAEALRRLATLLESPEAQRVVVPTPARSAPEREHLPVERERDPVETARVPAIGAADARGQEGFPASLGGTAPAPTEPTLRGAPGRHAYSKRSDVTKISQRRPGPHVTCLSPEGLPEGLWDDLLNASGLAAIAASEDGERDGPESVAELRRLAAAAEALIARPASLDAAAVFAGMLPDCPLAEATETLISSVIPTGQGQDNTLESSEGKLVLAERSDWQLFRKRFLAAPDSLREELAFRLAAVFIERGAAEALALIEPHAVSSSAAASLEPRRALIEAELAGARGDRTGAIATLRRLAGPRSTAAQAAAILLAERIDPATEPPLPAGWLAHLDLLGSIALEASGTRLARRAALAETRLAEAVLGPAEALRRLSLAHQRGLIDTPTLQMAAAATGKDASGSSGLGLPVLLAHQPTSFASLEAHAPASLPELALGALHPAPLDAPAETSDVLEIVADERDAAAEEPTGGSTMRRRPSMPDWRSIVSADLAGDAAHVGNAPPGHATPAGSAVPASPASSTSSRTARAGEAGSEVAKRSEPERFPIEEASVPSAAAPRSLREDLLDDVERFLAITERDVQRIEEILEDG